MKKRLFALTLALCMILALCAGCGSSEPQAASSAAETPESSAAEGPASADNAQTPAEPEDIEDAETEPESDDAGDVPEEADDGYDFTEANAKTDFSGFQEMLKTLTTEFPVVDEPETVSYFFGFASASLNYIPGGVLENHQIWAYPMKKALQMQAFCQKRPLPIFRQLVPDEKASSHRFLPIIYLISGYSIIREMSRKGSFDTIILRRREPYG